MVKKAKVLFEYEADSRDELTIRVGDEVEIVNKNTDIEGWWEVRIFNPLVVSKPIYCSLPYKCEL